MDVSSLLAWEKRDPNAKKALRFKVKNTRNEEMYPGFATVAGTALPLSYAFSPSDPLDGVTLHVPLSLLCKVEQKDIPIPPGYRSELILAALKALPKKIRMQLSPLSSFAKKIEENMGEGEFFSSLASLLKENFQIFEPIDWDEVKSKIPPYLLCNISVEKWGKRKEVLEVSKDLEYLKKKYAPMEEAERKERVQTAVERLKKEGNLLGAGRVLKEAGLKGKGEEVILEGLVEGCNISEERILSLWSPKEKLLLFSLENRKDLCTDLKRKAALSILSSLPSDEEEFYFAKKMLQRNIESEIKKVGEIYLKIAEKK